MVFEEEEEEFDFNNRLFYLFNGYYISTSWLNWGYSNINLKFNKDEIRKVAFYYELYFPGELIKSNIDISEIVDDDDKIYNALLTFFNPWIYGKNRLYKFYHCYNNVLTFSIYDKLYNGNYNDFKNIDISIIYQILDYINDFFPSILNYNLNLTSNDFDTTYKPSKEQKIRIFTYLQERKNNIKEIYEIFNLKHKSQNPLFSKKIFYTIMNKKCINYNDFMTANLENLEFILDIFNYFNSGNNIDVSNIINFIEKRKTIADKLCNENNKLKIALSYFNDIIAGHYDKVDSLTDPNLNILDLNHFLLLYDALFPGNNISYDVSNENINRNRIFFLKEGRLLEFKNRINDIKKIKNSNSLFRKLCYNLSITVKEPPKKDDKHKGKDGKGKDGKGKDGKGKDGKGKKIVPLPPSGYTNKKGGANDSELDISIIRYIFNSCLLLFKNKIKNYQQHLDIINSNDNPVKIYMHFDTFCDTNIEYIIKLYNICINQKNTLYSDKIFTKKVYDSFAVSSCPYGKKWWKIESKYYENLRKITKAFILFMKYNNINDKKIIINWETDSIEKIYFFLCYNKIHLFDFLDYIIKHKVYYKKNFFTYEFIGTGENPDIYIYISDDYYETSLKSYKAYIDEIFEIFKIYMKNINKIDLKAEEVKVSNYTKKRYRVSLAFFDDYFNYLNDLYNDINNFLIILEKIFFNPPIEVDIELNLNVYLYIANQFSKLYPDLLDKNIKDKKIKFYIDYTIILFSKKQYSFRLYEELFRFFAKHFKHFDKLFNYLNKPYKEKKILEEQQTKEAKIDSEIQKLKEDIIKLLIREKDLGDDSLLIINLESIYHFNYSKIIHNDFTFPTKYVKLDPLDMYNKLFTFINELNDKVALTIIFDILKTLSNINCFDKDNFILKNYNKIIHNVYRLYIVTDKNNNSLIELLKFYKILNIIYKITGDNETDFFIPLYYNSKDIDITYISKLIVSYYSYFNILIFINNDNTVYSKYIQALKHAKLKFDNFKVEDLTRKQKDRKDKKDKFKLN